MTVAQISTRPLEYDCLGTRLEGHLAVPKSDAARAPAVALCHDWSGINGGMRDRAERFARLGYVCLVLDVYGQGRRGDEMGDNSHLMDPLLADRALLRRRLVTGIDVLRSSDGVLPDRIAAVGYCFGGLCALDLARSRAPGVRAAVSVHGGLAPPGPGVQGSIEARVLVLHGWQDPMAPPQAVLALTQELTEVQASWQLHVYGGAMHAFTFEGAHMPERGIAYHPEADRWSWRAIVALLREELADEPSATVQQ